MTITVTSYSSHFFSKFLQLVNLKSKTGTVVAFAFRSMLNEPKYSKRKRRTIWVGTDKIREFLNFKEIRDARASSIKCAINVPSWDGHIGRFAIGFINILVIKIPTYTWNFFLSLSRSTTTHFTRRSALRHC